MPRMLDSQPTLHGNIQTVADNTLIRFQHLDQTRFAGPVVTDKSSKRSELDDLAIDNSLKVPDSYALQSFGGCHFINPLATSR